MSIYNYPDLKRFEFNNQIDDITHLDLDADGEVWTFDRSNHIDAHENAGKFQTRLTLSSAGGDKKYIRLKQSKTINEAVTYYKMNLAGQEPLQKHIPRFYGALDQTGKKIDLKKELESHSVGELVQKYPNAYIFIEDLYPSTNKTGEAPKDFKFVHQDLRENELERVIHMRNKTHGLCYKILRSIGFACSRCSFALQQGKRSCAGIFEKIANIIKRLICIFETKPELRRQLEKLNPAQLRTKIDQLKALEADVSRSAFTFSDSSLLFVPSQDNDFNIHLIDFEHGIHEDEVPSELFSKMRQAMSNSIHEITDLAERIIGQKF